MRTLTKKDDYWYDTPLVCAKLVSDIDATAWNNQVFEKDSDKKIETLQKKEKVHNKSFHLQIDGKTYSDFTLVEMLMAFLLLSFVSLMTAVIANAVLSSTTDMEYAAKAELFGMETLDGLSKELRYGTNIFYYNGEVRFDRSTIIK